jgi:hypothetical protein
MRQLIASVAFLVAAALMLTAAHGGDKTEKTAKEVTLKGKITCAKCDLGVETKCATVIVVKEDKKDVTYYFDAKAHGANHKQVCTAAKEGTVVGTVSTKDDKKIVTVSKIEFAK